MTTSMPQFTPNELVWYEEGGQIHSAGYKVESLFKTLGIAPMTTMNAPVMSGGKASVGQAGEDAGSVSDLFRFMGIPAGLSSVIGSDVSSTHEAMTGGGSDVDIRRTEGGLVPSSLFDKLVKLAGPEDASKDTDTSGKSRKKTTRKRGGKKASGQSGKKRKTRKHRG